MSSAASPVVERKFKVVRLKPVHASRLVHTLYQEDLEKGSLLARQISNAKRAYKKHMRYLEDAWRNGATIEMGVLTIEEVLHRGGGTFVEKWEKPGIRVTRRKTRAS